MPPAVFRFSHSSSRIWVRFCRRGDIRIFHGCVNTFGLSRPRDFVIYGTGDEFDRLRNKLKPYTGAIPPSVRIECPAIRSRHEQDTVEECVSHLSPRLDIGRSGCVPDNSGARMLAPKHTTVSRSGRPEFSEIHRELPGLCGV